METSNLEKIYQRLIEETDHILKENENLSRLEALSEALAETHAEGDLSELRKSFQFAYLYQVKEEPVQPNHQLTPDAIGYLVAHLVKTFTADREEVDMIEAGSGTGHLSMTVKEQAENVKLHGVEVDPLLARMNVGLCEFLKVPMDIYPQNIIEPARLPHADFAVGDLPVGYYPLPVEGFTTAFKEGRSFAHLLMIEAAMSYVEDDGIGIFVVPSNILEENNETIKEYISKDATLLMFLNLPNTIFRSENQRKSIIVLQKNFKPLNQADVLIGDVPDFKNASQFKHFLDNIESWYDDYARKNQ